MEFPISIELTFDHIEELLLFKHRLNGSLDEFKEFLANNGLEEEARKVKELESSYNKEGRNLDMAEGRIFGEIRQTIEDIEIYEIEKNENKSASTTQTSTTTTTSNPIEPTVGGVDYAVAV